MASSSRPTDGAWASSVAVREISRHRYRLSQFAGLTRLQLECPWLRIAKRRYIAGRRSAVSAVPVN